MAEEPDTTRRSQPGELRLYFALPSAGLPVAIEALLRDGLREWGLLEPFEEAVDVFVDLLRLALAFGAVDAKLRVDRHEPSMHFEVLGERLDLPGELCDRLQSITGDLWSRNRSADGDQVKATVSRTGGPDAAPL